jgi:hypothetical protein
MSKGGRSKQGEYGSYMQSPHRTLHRIHFDQRDDRQKKFHPNFTIVHQQVMGARVSPGAQISWRRLSGGSDDIAIVRKIGIIRPVC